MPSNICTRSLKVSRTKRLACCPSPSALKASFSLQDAPCVDLPIAILPTDLN
ncbi:hypothetical protein MBAV_004809 [Candidatus Magnetobacterium bavaricum]|uniref:Uncharacterized protein n=1 Tax=Candidatus Magnetobacterium bavaricum TaxID=29290 RepID=A0A0F3GM75_9BACT|nr:hypothetical protein MBAV_004809 [Candidatus Magnetobacterium bavaricum]